MGPPAHDVVQEGAGSLPHVVHDQEDPVLGDILRLLWTYRLSVLAATGAPAWLPGSTTCFYSDCLGNRYAGGRARRSVRELIRCNACLAPASDVHVRSSTGHNEAHEGR